MFFVNFVRDVPTRTKAFALILLAVICIVLIPVVASITGSSPQPQDWQLGVKSGNYTLTYCGSTKEVGQAPSGSKMVSFLNLQRTASYYFSVPDNTTFVKYGDYLFTVKDGMIKLSSRVIGAGHAAC